MRIDKFLLLIAMLPLLGADTPDWRPADPEYRIELPRDHGPHLEHKIEWWYYTGHLESTDTREFGFQLTFFRVGVRRGEERSSRWALRDLWMAHFAITDIGKQSFRSAEKIGRGAVDWAGAKVDAQGRAVIWNQTWRAEIDGSTHRLRAKTRDMAIDFDLDSQKPVVLHGKQGFSQKGRDPKNASHYYSFTRLATTGTIHLRNETFEVQGESWMDHEFGSSFLESGQVGWDWFSLILDDGRELMLFQIRGRDANKAPELSGTIVRADGSSRTISKEALRFIPGKTWRSPESGAVYPVEWRIEGSDLRAALEVRAATPNQELSTPRSTGVDYWEGSVRISGELEGRAVRGVGYLEMTGYDGRRMDERMR